MDDRDRCASARSPPCRIVVTSMKCPVFIGIRAGARTSSTENETRHEFGKSAWDWLTAQDSVFLSRRYLRVPEDCGPRNVRQRYALVFRGREAVAAVAAQAVVVIVGRMGSSTAHPTELSRNTGRSASAISLAAPGRPSRRARSCIVDRRAGSSRRRSIFHAMTGRLLQRIAAPCSRR